MWMLVPFLMVLPPVIVLLVVVVVLLIRVPLAELIGPLDDLIELAAVEPDATAFRAVIDFDAISVRHHQFPVAVWTFHVFQVIVAAFKLPAKGVAGKK